MDPKFQPSFIPKQSLGLPRPGAPAAPLSIFVTISIVIFLIAAVLAAGVFLWSKLVEKDIGAINGELAKAREAFNPALVGELERLDGRIESAKKILDSHIAVSALFALLEKATLVDVSFGDFSFDAGNGKEVKVTMKGQAKNFASVALQSDAFTAEKFIKNPIFSDLNLDDSGNVLFTFTATLDPALTTYYERELSAAADALFDNVTTGSATSKSNGGNTGNTGGDAGSGNGRSSNQP